MTVDLSLPSAASAERFLALVGDGDEYGAVELVTGLLADGVPPQRILIDLIGGAQHRVGDVWAAGAEEAVTRLARNWPPPMPEAQLPAYLGDDEYTYVVRHRPDLIASAMSRLTESYPAMRRYNQRQLDATAEDMAHVVDFLAAALYVSEPAIFTGFVDWTAGVLRARGVPPVALSVGLTVVGAQLLDCPAALAVLEAGTTHLPK